LASVVTHRTGRSRILRNPARRADWPPAAILIINDESAFKDYAGWRIENGLAGSMSTAA